MIQLEEAANSQRLANFDLEFVKFEMYSRADQIFQIRLDSEGPRKGYHESLLDGFTVQSVGSEENIVCAGRFIGCRDDVIFLKITQDFEDILSCYDKSDQYFTINFFTNRLVYQLQLNALEWFKNHKLHAVLINNQRYDQVDYKILSEHTLSPFSESLNEEQKSAVQHIVWGQNHGTPILLHGPPGRTKSISTAVFYFIISFSYELGTGKTRTLVASIAEIVRGTNDFVLVLAHSNAACDEIATRLLEVLRKGELFRLYAKSYNKETLNAKIKPICNLYDGGFQFPSLNYLHRFRVVVSTLLTAGCLVRARGVDPDFDSSHFTRIFIDEAGSIHEPDTMILIAGSYLPGFKNDLTPEMHIYKIFHNFNIVYYPIQVYALNMV